MEMEANGERDDEQMQENGAQKPSPLENGDSVKEKLRALLEKDKADFSAWTSLISEIEKTSLNGIEVIQRMYDAFLSEFPLCYGYWNKYASHVAFYCSLNEVEEVYERAAEALPYSVDLWVSYCSFGMLAYEDPSDVRRLFERGFSFIGKDYMSSLLWDKYIEFEYSQKQWSRLAYVYINTLRFPTKTLSNYYMSFKKLVAISDEEMGNTSIETGPNCETTDAEIMNVIRNLKDQHDGLPSPSMLKKYIAVGEILYHRSSQLDEKIKFHEARIQRPYFHVKPLDDCQLENWHQYLDFVELQGDFDWTVKLYERCLIPCAIYSEFWIRYVEFVEAKGGREIANHALQRALKVFFKKVPAFHLYCSMFKEKTGDVNGARATCLRPQLEPNSEFVEYVVREANKEKRMGNPESACMVYEKAVEMAKMNQNLQIISIIYVKFARFKFKVSNDIDAAIEVFTRGIQEVPCKSIIQEMVNFVSLRGGRPQLQKLDSIIASLLAPESAVSQSLNSYEREEISNMFLEFVDLHGTIDEIMKAWDRHRKLFPHLMKPPFVTWHSPPVRDKPLVNDVVERMRMFASESHQACEGDGPVGSRMLLLDHQSLEDNCSISSKGTAIDKLQGDINDIEEREELIEVTEDVEKNSINDHKGGEEVVQVAEDVEMQSMPKGTDQMVEVTEYLQKLSTNDNKGHVEMVEDTKNVENYSILEQTNALHEAAKKLAHECEGAAQVPETSPEYPKLEHQVPRLLETLSINSTDNRSQRSSATGDHNIPHEATSEAKINELLVEGNSMPSQVQLQNSPLHSVCDSTPPESRSTSQVQMQAHDHTTLQQASAVNVYPQNASGAGNWPQMYYVQSSQSQQWQVDPQMQYSSAGATNTQSVVAQGYPYQSQANQIAYAYAQPQSGTQPQAQTQVNQQSIYTQNSQGIPPHITQYYQQQQQYHFLQQQNQLASQQPQQLQLQQYQQLIYMQQQQQQQLYLQQQQTYYTQQQQILQQQQFQQLPHQEQQLLLNEHQQQFFQQQQQQFLQLQQQHQQQLQQLQQQQQISASDAKALSSSYILQSSHAQHTSNQDGPEYSEPTIISTEKGDKFQNAEQSGPSISVQADTPPNQ